MTVDVLADRRTVILKALGEPVRWRIVERLADEDLCVCHLVEDLDLPQPLVSHHLKTLREAGLVESDRFKQWIYYRLVPEALASVANELSQITKVTKRSRRRRPCC